MKYTALYWALGFVETDFEDVFQKSYPNKTAKTPLSASGNCVKMRIDAKKQSINYQQIFQVKNLQLLSLKRHKDFVILEVIDRLLNKGYKSQDIKIIGDDNKADLLVNSIAIICAEWDDYITEKPAFIERASRQKNMPNTSILYRSRLVSGLLEFENYIFHKGEFYNYGFFEDELKAFELAPKKIQNAQIAKRDNLADFEIFEDKLISYKGKNKLVKIPEGIQSIAASAFWDNRYIEKVELPESLITLGGDAFYYCVNLQELNLPKNLAFMGNNPFAACPKLRITNHSKNFVILDDVLYNKDKSLLINYPQWKKEQKFTIPNSVICIGKHSFFGVNNLLEVEIPASVIKFENMPFSGCENLKIINNSESYIIEDGIIYNKFKSTIIGCLQSSPLTEYKIPNSITSIGRNAFWNCQKIHKIILNENLQKLGYNPFASCVNLSIYSNSLNFIVEDGILYNKDKTQIICATNIRAKKPIKIPNSVTTIGRGAFSGCKDLQKIDFNKVKFIYKSAFTNCTKLTEIFLPDNVIMLGEWSFSHCYNLTKVSASAAIHIEKNAFSGTCAKLEKRPAPNKKRMKDVK